MNADEQIALINHALLQKDLPQALKLNEEFWEQGGELSTQNKHDYIDILLNIDEIERAELLLNDAIDEPLDNTEMIPLTVKYAILAPRLILIKQLGEIKAIYTQNQPLFDWAKKVTDERTLLEYSLLIKTARKLLKGKILKVDVSMVQDKLEVNFYTTNDEIAGIGDTQKMVKEIEHQFIKRDLEIPQKMDLNIFSLEHFND